MKKCIPYSSTKPLNNRKIIEIAISKCPRAKQKLEDDRTELCNYWEPAL